MAPIETTRGIKPARQVLVTRRGSAPWIDELGGYLEPRGVRLRQAFDSPGSLRLLEREGFDLAIVSEWLEPVGGLSMLRLIRSVQRALPCVYVAAAPSARTLQTALELDAFSVLSEPVRLDLVTRLVKRIYEREWNLGIDSATA